MSRMSFMLMAVTTAALTAGAAQFALGRDLGRDLGLGRDLRSLDLGRSLMGVSPASTAVPDAAGRDVNRAVKSDRLPQAGHAGESRTVSARVGDLANTSVLIRLNQPAARTQNEPRKPAVPPPAEAARKTFACEPTVSLLTEIAKQLAPARCLS